ncbi:MAG: hypothetical protein HYS17_09575 [Micavibrio aeruginosavorus]|uniref:Uncharacterized protein n=1 Tax=Micavibrio aeruginosavorus TaxID=349221 RepID=A0A7T5R1E0_9BACT|nr:MAG: hypothetical protein HYS17_09575 [Micavibrio aeruginosavorus]
MFDKNQSLCPDYLQNSKRLFGSTYFYLIGEYNYFDCPSKWQLLLRNLFTPCWKKNAIAAAGEWIGEKRMKFEILTQHSSGMNDAPFEVVERKGRGHPDTKIKKFLVKQFLHRRKP